MLNKIKKIIYFIVIFFFLIFINNLENNFKHRLYATNSILEVTPWKEILKIFENVELPPTKIGEFTQNGRLYKKILFMMKLIKLLK